MALIEVLRVQRMLTWYGGILTLVTLAILAFGSHTSVDVNGTMQTFSGVTVPFAAVVPLAMFFAATFASWAGTAFNRESVTRDISWTKPLPRPLFALQIVAVDLVAIASIYVLALLAIASILWRLQFTVVADPTLGTVLALGLGVSFMWYALVNLLTCMLPPSARMIGGIIWPIALLLLALAQLGGAFGAVVRAIDVINPLAYMNGVSSSANGIVQDAVTTLPLDLRPAAVYAFAALFCALAILIWPRKEA